MTTELPQHVVFRGDNGLYLSARSKDGMTYLKFASDDKDDATVQNTTTIPKPSDPTKVHIKSESAKYWKRDSTTNFIFADTDHPADDDNDTLFVVTTTQRGNVIALRNVGNDMYCARDTTGATNSLKACARTSTAPETHLEVVIHSSSKPSAHTRSCAV